MIQDLGAAKLDSFVDFYEGAKRAQIDDFDQIPGFKAQDEAAFKEQKQHLLDLYAGVDVEHSFVDAAGQVFDCIPIKQQPALRNSGKPLAQPVDIPKAIGTPAPPLAHETTDLLSGKTDRFGNAMSCPAGTVAIRRLTLDELGRFETLGHFLRKGPRSLRRHPRNFGLPEQADPNDPPHEYAHAYQTVQNVGGHSILSVWDPPITGDQIFSLSQQWFTATAAAGVQTAEVGWQVYPLKYGHAKPVLFTYWTADGYQTTGSYSTDAGDFVQYSGNCPVGIALEDVSIANGRQVEIELAYYLVDGNWWLYVNGSDASHAVGYYPVSLYRGGPMATEAAEIDFGGETVGKTSYPPMGSGAFAKDGAGKAAFHRNIYYNVNGTAQGAGLTPSQDWPNSYTIAFANSAEWGVSFFFGGPGSPAQLA